MTQWILAQVTDMDAEVVDSLCEAEQQTSAPSSADLDKNRIYIIAAALAVLLVIWWYSQ